MAPYRDWGCRGHEFNSIDRLRIAASSNGLKFGPQCVMDIAYATVVIGPESIDESTFVLAAPDFEEADSDDHKRSSSCQFRMVIATKARAIRSRRKFRLDIIIPTLRGRSLAFGTALIVSLGFFFIQQHVKLDGTYNVHMYILLIGVLGVGVGKY